MSADIEWVDPAFEKLEALPSTMAFEIIRRVDLLAAFPEMGVSLHSRYPQLGNCRQLIVGASYRIIYEFDAVAGSVYILVLQHCRQRLPTVAELRFRRSLKQDAE
ncbi:MAG: type II toxin-antitoxin system RelE/ParE family toxin [Acidobacteriota bacterium]